MHLFFLFAHLAFSDTVLKTIVQSGSESFLLTPGRYRMQCYGARGGNAYDDGDEMPGSGGFGAYTSGYINIAGDQTFVVTVGGVGLSNQPGGQDGGSNGGGKAGKDWSLIGTPDDGGGSGGGATDVRYRGTATSDRIMVAAGGSGGCGTTKGAPGGDQYCRDANGNIGKCTTTSTGGTGANCDPGNMGYGASGGGGGYFGGIGGTNFKCNKNDCSVTVGHGGSSYISSCKGTFKHIAFDTCQMTIGGAGSLLNGKFVLSSVYNCSANCNSCSSSTVCTQCKSNYYLTQSKCQSQCPRVLNNVHYGKNKAKGECTKCSVANCDNCLEDYTRCTKCLSGYGLYNNKCYSQCPDGMFLSSTGMCEFCSTSCKTCSGTKDTCTSCKENTYLLDNKCLDTCPIIKNGIHYGKNGAAWKCSQCTDVKCTNCQSNYGICTICAEGYSAKNGQCVINPTSEFTSSEFFSDSVTFTKSNGFSNTDHFTNSISFSRSSSFSESSSFSNSLSFSKSNSFTESSIFSKSTTFIPSNSFSKSDVFSQSSSFTKSRVFTSSERFTKSETLVIQETIIPQSNGIDTIGEGNSEKGTKSGFPSYVIYIIIAVVAIVTMILIFIFFKRRKKEEQEMPATEMTIDFTQTAISHDDIGDTFNSEALDPFMINNEEADLHVGNQI